MRLASTLTDDDSPCDTLTPEQLCLGYAHRVYQFALMVCRDATEAEDLAQDALVRAISRLDQFDPARGNLETWLWRIVTNVARDAGRVKRRQRALLQRLFLAQPAVELTEPDVSLHIADEDLLAAIRELDARPRAVIALRFGADLDYAGVGEALGLSPAAAKMATRRALATLRRLLEVREDKKS
jgi:RNA polymerase sigma-70 factor, ECF subfamily